MASGAKLRSVGFQGVEVTFIPEQKHYISVDLQYYIKILIKYNNKIYSIYKTTFWSFFLTF